MSSWIKEFRFYKNLFSTVNIRDAFYDYLLYAFSLYKFKARPLSLNFLITAGCNLRCSICSFGNDLDPSGSAMSLGDFEKFISSIPASGKPALFFSGGEPFSRPDMLDILQAAKDKGFSCGINTNGTLLNEEKISRLAGLGIELVIFSLYGPQAVHETITSAEGSYARAVQSLALLCRRKTGRTRVVLSCTITRQGLDTLEAISALGKELGVDAVKFEHLNFSTSSERQPDKDSPVSGMHTLLTDAYGLDTSFGRRLAVKLAEIKRKYRGFVLVKPDLSRDELSRWYSSGFRPKRKCFFSWHSLFIRPDGMAVPCQFLLDYELGDIKKDKLRHIFNNDRAYSLRKELGSGLLPQCSRCCKL